ncbi:MAG TPA: hypothetical protein VKR57_10845 [Terriglobales bacterium]|nr:hypothetical protein [Terriglobales bacterium]
MVSPIEGTVSDINPGVRQDPKLALRDPYGRAASRPDIQDPGRLAFCATALGYENSGNNFA